MIPKERQTLLFSATLTKKVEDLITLSLRDPQFIKAGQESSVATVSTLQQGANFSFRLFFYKIN